MSKFNNKSKNDKYDEEESKFTKGNRKPNRRGNGVKSRSRSTMNDIAWYAANPQLLIDSASLPRAWATGLSHELTHDYSGQFSHATTPGFLAAEVVLDPLSFNDDSDPVNVVARKITGYIRSFNSGAKNYDANDLMIRLLGEGAFIANLNWAQRLLATVNMYSAMNRYMPEGLINAQGVDFNDLRLHLNDFRTALNNIIANASSIIFVPNGFHIYKRWAWLFSNYYADSQSVKDQLYFLYPKGFLQFEIDEDTSMGKLSFTEWKSYIDPLKTALTYENIITGLRDQLDAIINDQDFATMRGDMMKAYGNSDYTFGLIPENFVAVPAHDPIVLTQFKNIRTMYVDITTQTDRFDIVQDGDAAYLRHPDDVTVLKRQWSWDRTIGGTSAALYNDGIGDFIAELYRSDHPCDTYNPAPTAVDNMEDSRLTTMVFDIGAPMEDEDLLPVEYTHGSEVVTKLLLGRRFKDVTGWKLDIRTLHTFNLFFNMNSPVVGSGSWLDCNPPVAYEYLNDITQFANLLSDVSAFDYMPPLYVLLCEFIEDGADVEFVPNLTGGNVSWPIMRVSNLAFFTCEMVRKMNNCALKSLFNITGFSNPKESKISSK